MECEQEALSETTSVPLEAILCTNRLWERPQRQPDYETENQALAKLVQALAEAPRTILQALADTLLQVLKADSAGMSLLADDGKSFYWAAIAGDWSPHLGGGTPRHFGPCGDVLDCNRPLLFEHWEKRYPYLEEATPLAEEGLLVPFHVGGKAVGTIWTIAHTTERRFDAEDLRQLESMARFASAAYQAVRLLDAEEASRSALQSIEAEIRSRQMLEAVADTTPECIKIVGADGTLHYVNPAGLQMIGATSLDQVRGLCTVDLIAPDDRESWRSTHDRVRRGERLTSEFDIIGLTGVRRQMESHAAPLALSDGSVAQLSVMRDVTHRKQQEQQLRDRERQLRELLEALPAALYTTDAEGRITFYNEAAVALAGRRPAAGDKWCVTWKLYHPDGQPLPHDQCPMAVAIKERRPVRGAEAIAERPDGTRVPFIPYPTPLLDNAGNLVGAVNMLVDITDRKRVEEVQRASEERMKRLNESLEERVREEVAERERTQQALFQAQKLEAIGQLTGGVAHDFNNLLTAIVGNLDALLSEVLTDRGRHHVDAATRAAERGALLTQHLLAYARKQYLDPKPVNLNELINGIDELLRRTLGGLVGVETDLTDDLWYAAADPTELELAVLNLAINARDAMPTGGTLYVETRNCSIPHGKSPENLPPGDYVHLSIRDTGEGMPPEVLAKAMDPFYTTKEPGKGSGLGLSQVYGVITQCCGAVKLESTPGEGTAVSIWLPRATQLPAGEQQQDRDDIEAAGRPATILVVDDDSAVRQICVEILEEAGYRIEQAASGAAAIDLLNSGIVVDVAVVDYAMPRMSGVELVRLARQQRPELPVIYATGYADTREQLGEAVILRKPYRSAELLRVVERTLEDHARRNSANSNVVSIRPATVRYQSSRT